MVISLKSITLYGIKNCDTVKKARLWLDTHEISYCFHDYRVDGLSSELLTSLSAQLGWSSLLNMRSTTWRQLDSNVRLNLHHADAAIKLMLEQPALIKRPLLIRDTHMILGFTPQRYNAFFAETNA